MAENLSLYKITSAFPMLMSNDEITDEDKEKIEEELTELLQKKSQDTIGYVRNVELTIDAMKEEEKRISTARKALENRLTRFKTYLNDCLTNLGTNEIQTSIGSIKIQKNPLSVEILDESKVPAKYKKIKQEEVIDKMLIKKEFKETGEMLEGVKYNTDNTRVVIE